MLSPKQIGTICFAFSLILISQKSFSENIPSENPTCDNSTLGVYSGSVALEPDWGANRINLRWYNNNTLMTNVTAAESECEYDGSIDVATAPSRTGYNFSGWRVRPQVDFNTLMSLSTGRIGYAKGVGYCAYYDGTWTEGKALCQTNFNFFGLNNEEWRTEFNTGTVYGMARCSAKTGNTHDYTWGGDRNDWASTFSELEAVQGGNYCWCLVTGWKPTGDNQVIYSSLHSLSWILVAGPMNYCMSSCASYCASRVRDMDSFRAALFAPATNNNQ